MKTFLTILLFSCAIPLLSLSPKEKAKLYANGYAGKEFVVTVPPNYDPDYHKDNLEIAILAIDKTKVEVTSERFDIDLTYFIPEGTVSRHLSTLSDEISWELESFDIHLENESSDRSIRISTDKPVYVTLINSKRYTSDGLALLPVESWGYEYIHNNFYDFGWNNASFGSGFQIVASEDESEVEIAIRGIGGQFAGTKNGFNIGDRITTKLDMNHLFQVEGNGSSNYMFDLSGTQLSSSGSVMDKKPFSVISYNKITWLPQSFGAGDPLYITSPPVSSYGTEFVTQAFLQDNNKGDYFRVVSAEDNNEVSFQWFDPVSKAKVGDINVTLSKGEVWSPFESDMINNTAQNFAFGQIKITSSKLSMVYQYLCSSQWYIADLDPMYVNLTPTDLWTQGFAFSAPYNTSQASFRNSLSLTFKGSADNKKLHDSLLASIKIDDVPLGQIVDPSEIRNIPGTDYYAVNIRITAGGYHYVLSDTDITGYVYGQSEWDSYGWITGGNIRYLDKNKNIPSAYHLDYETIRKPEYTDIIVYSDYGNPISEMMWESKSSLGISIREIEVSQTDFEVSENQTAKAYRVSHPESFEPEYIDMAVALKGGKEILDFQFLATPWVSMDKYMILDAQQISLGKIHGNNEHSFSTVLRTNPNNPSIIYDIEVSKDIRYKINNDFPFTLSDASEVEFTVIPTDQDYPDGSSYNGVIKFLSDSDTLEITVNATIGYTNLVGKDITLQNFGVHGECLQTKPIELFNNGSMPAKEIQILTIESQTNLVENTGADFQLKLAQMFPEFTFKNINHNTVDIESDDYVSFGEICFTDTLARELIIKFGGNKEDISYSDKPFIDIKGDFVTHVEEDHTDIFSLMVIEPHVYKIQSSGHEYVIRLVGIDGKLLIENKGYKGKDNIIDLNTQGAGVYLLSIVINGQTYTKKIVVE